MDNYIEKFKHNGRLFLWKFNPENRNYPGWNLTGDTEGCNSLMELLERMSASSFPSRKSIATEPATSSQVRAATGSKPYKTINKLVLRFHKGEPQLWQTEDVSDGLQIAFGEREIKLFQTALLRVIKGESDFAIGNSNDEDLVYFWRIFENE